ncbi:C2 domain-containing protein [Balamuthia mandrillaris]
MFSKRRANGASAETTTSLEASALGEATAEGGIAGELDEGGGAEEYRSPRYRAYKRQLNERKKEKEHTCLNKKAQSAKSSSDLLRQAFSAQQIALSQELDLAQRTLRKRSTKEKKKSNERGSGIVYFDVIVIEAEKLSSENNEAIKACCSVQLQDSSQVARTVATLSSRTFSWNTSFTFSYAEEKEDEADTEQRKSHLLEFTIKNKLQKGSILGKLVLDVSSFSMNQVHDLWLDLRHPLYEAPEEWLWSGPQSDRGSLQRSTAQSCGFLHCRVQRHQHFSKGMLAHLGVPLKGIPVRVAVGDIVMFSERVATAKRAMHLATGSEWDHLAMIAVYEDDKKKTKEKDEEENGSPNIKLVLLEATKVGVDACNLNVRLQSYRESARLGIRRLQHFPRTPRCYNVVQEFVESVLGKPYHLNLVEIFKGLVGKQQLANPEEHEEGFFCSQLVAAAYQKLELLPSTVASTNYLPHHFDQAEDKEKEEERHQVKLFGFVGFEPIVIIPKRKAQN